MSRRRSIAERIISEGANLLIAAHKSATQARRESLALQSGIQQIDQMGGAAFEEYLADLFKRLGYIVENTKASHDYGADLIIRKNGNRIAVQVKRYEGSVGLGAVQEAVAAKSHYKCNLAMVVTNRYFTKSATKLAKSNKVILWDRASLVEKILEIKQSVAQSIPTATNQPARPSNHGYLVEKATGRTQPLLKELIAIGRDPSSDVVVNSSRISRQHARILFEAGQLVLVDLDSTNGTIVNGVRIKKCELRDGDTIAFDREVFVYSKKPFIGNDNLR